ncbi:MAG: c-type cytochrome [Hyphomonadaceae bacterium]
MLGAAAAALALSACAAAHPNGLHADATPAAPPQTSGAPAAPPQTSGAPAAPSVSAASGEAARGLSYAQAYCASCHAVTPGEISPNPEAPTWEAVANAPGATFETMRDWLRSSHDFPAAMNFTIDPDRFDDLAAYLVTLQKRE